MRGNTANRTNQSPVSISPAQLPDAEHVSMFDTSAIMLPEDFISDRLSAADFAILLQGLIGAGDES
jgi:hypothetical protein